MKRTLGIFLALLSAVSVVQISAQTLEDSQALAEANYPMVRRFGLIERTADFTVENIRKGWLPHSHVTHPARRRHGHGGRS